MNLTTSPQQSPDALAAKSTPELYSVVMRYPVSPVAAAAREVIRGRGLDPYDTDRDVRKPAPGKWIGGAR